MVLVSKSPNRLAEKPGYVPPQLGAQPSIHELAVVRDCELGQYTQVGPFTTMHDSSMGDYSYIVQNCQVMWSTIGRFTSIASYVRLNPGNHPTWRPTQHHFTYRSRSYGFSAEDDAEFFDWRKSHWTTVGHDVWIGHGATVMPGVKVGNGAVIGAGAVVTRDVEPYTVVAGVPARVIKRRFPAEITDTLERIAWWDWSRAELNERFEDFKDLDQFLEKHG